ncbi:MAG: histidine kinase [Candidatus Borkfalkiaceae bacterium]|nr:histidine kinase [Clostridia bacterium]MDY6222579.1 histidine kinase [Christensenellaceae bacterium]
MRDEHFSDRRTDGQTGEVRPSQSRAKKSGAPFNAGENNLPSGGYFDGKGKTEKKPLSTKLVVVIYLVSVCAFLGYLIFVLLSDNVIIFGGRTKNDYRKINDYTLVKTENSQEGAGTLAEYSFTLGETPESGDCIAFYSVHQFCEVFIGGEREYGITTGDKNNIKTPGANWVMVPLSPDDAGKEVVIKIASVYKAFDDWETEILQGNELAIYNAQLEKDLPQLVLSVISAMMGLIFVASGLWRYIKKKQGEELMLLGLFSVLVGLWRFTDTRFTAFLFSQNPAFVYYCSICMLTLGVVPLMTSVRLRYGRLSRKFTDVYCIAATCVSLVQLALQVFGVADLRESLFVTHFIIIAGIVIVFCNFIFNKRNADSDRNRKTGNPAFLFIAGALSDLAAYYLIGNSSVLVFTLAAFILYTVISGINALEEYGERGKRIAEQEKELATSRMSLMLSQIKPHFIYNSLSAIIELCESEPHTAKEMLTDFSAYLRENMEFSGTETAVHFSKELKHVQTYLNLEKMRFGDRLNVIYDIRESNFFIPPLTVQPLVENAVKHGICAKKQGGTVTLSSFSSNGITTICVKDDGAGFDPAETLKDEGTAHVGIANVKKRLEMIAGAAMNIESEKGKGTTITILLKKNAAEKGEAIL